MKRPQIETLINQSLAYKLASVLLREYGTGKMGVIKYTLLVILLSAICSEGLYCGLNRKCGWMVYTPFLTYTRDEYAIHALCSCEPSQKCVRGKKNMQNRTFVYVCLNDNDVGNRPILPPEDVVMQS